MGLQTIHIKYLDGQVIIKSTYQHKIMQAT